MSARHAGLFAVAAGAALALILAAAPADAQYGAVDGEWRSYAGRQRQHQVLPAGPDRREQLRGPAHRLALAVRRRQRRPGVAAPARG